jgi:hypothetical protein
MFIKCNAKILIPVRLLKVYYITLFHNFVIYIVCYIRPPFCDFLYFELLFFMNSLLFHNYLNCYYICVCVCYWVELGSIYISHMLF